MNMVKKVSKILLLLFLGILLLEGFLRLGGVVYNEYQESGRVKADSENSFKVLALGESTTAGRYNWPHLAEEILNNKYNDIDIGFINKGINDTRSGILVAKAKDYIDKYEPDAVVSMMGANDGSYHNDDYYNIEYQEQEEEEKKEGRRERILSFFRNNSRVYKFIDLLFDPDLNKQENNINKYGGRKTGIDFLPEIIDKGGVEEGIEKCREIVRDNPDNTKAWTILGWLTAPDYSPYNLSTQDYKKWVKENKEAVKNFKKAIKINPRYYNAYYGIADLDPYKRIIGFSSLAEYKEATQEAISITEQGLRYYPDDHYLYSYLVRKKLDLYIINQKKGEQSEIDNFKLSKGRASKFDITRKNYNELYDMTKKKGVKLVAMQYPTRDTAELRSYFSPEKQQDIIFVSNKNNFKKALREHDYQDIFRDRCYNNFGHGTQMGRELIARELVSALEKEFNFN
jgi:hypothetical protein